MVHRTAGVIYSANKNFQLLLQEPASGGLPASNEKYCNTQSMHTIV